MEIFEVFLKIYYSSIFLNENYKYSDEKALDNWDLSKSIGIFRISIGAGGKY
jgi:hypothetical protein